MIEMSQQIAPTQLKSGWAGWEFRINLSCIIIDILFVFVHIWNFCFHFNLVLIILPFLKNMSSLFSFSHFITKRKWETLPLQLSETKLVILFYVLIFFLWF